MCRLTEQERAERTAQAIAARCPGGECGWCFEGPERHPVTFDRFDEPVVHCAAELDQVELEHAAYQQRRTMLGGLS